MQSSAAASRHLPIRKDWLAATQEPALEPDRPIIDPHHHLWDRPNNRYLFHDLLEDLNSGHNIRATVFLECREMYRAEGPPELRSLGETQFVAGVSAMSESGKYGAARACAGIIGNVDFRVGLQPIERLDTVGGKNEIEILRLDLLSEFLADQQFQIGFIIDYEDFFWHCFPPANISRRPANSIASTEG